MCFPAGTTAAAIPDDSLLAIFDSLFVDRAEWAAVRRVSSAWRNAAPSLRTFRRQCVTSEFCSLLSRRRPLLPQLDEKGGAVAVVELPHASSVHAWRVLCTYACLMASAIQPPAVIRLGRSCSQSNYYIQVWLPGASVKKCMRILCQCQPKYMYTATTHTFQIHAKFVSTPKMEHARTYVTQPT